MTVRLYQLTWAASVALLGVLGLIFAFVVATPALVVVIFLTLASCAAIVSGALRLLEDRPAHGTRWLVCRVGRDSVLAGWAGVALCGFGQVIGAELVLVVVLLSVTAPPVAGWLIRWPHPNDTEYGRPSASPVNADPVEELTGYTGAELYSVWYASFSEVLKSPVTGQTATVAQARQFLLDEFERRHPAEFSAWLNSGGLAGEPPRFLLDGRDD